MTTSATAGLEVYLAELEERLERAVGSHAGIVAEVGAEAISAGGKRLRPLLVFLSSPPEASGCGRCSRSSPPRPSGSRPSRPASRSSSCTWRPSSMTT